MVDALSPLSAGKPHFTVSWMRPMMIPELVG